MPMLFVMIRIIDGLHADALVALSCGAAAMGFDPLSQLYR
jgi:hypothetical protein